MSSLTPEKGYLLYRTPYDPGLVAAFKAVVPAVDRQWDKERRVWKVHSKHGPALVGLAKQYLDEDVYLPNAHIYAPRQETRILEVRYLGTTKDRGAGGERTAFGMVAGEWAVVFTEKVLREWFNAEARPDEEISLYAVLGVPPAATVEELRSAYRRLARTWHPDVCREPDAGEVFKRINHAYEILKVPAIRAKYDAGMTLQASLNSSHDLADALAASIGVSYRAPLRCGLIMAEGRELFGRFIVEKVLAWSDVIDAQGRVLVTSWPMGATEPVEVWS